jgi:hypothetical protein
MSVGLDAFAGYRAPTTATKRSPNRTMPSTLTVKSATQQRLQIKSAAPRFSGSSNSH